MARPVNRPDAGDTNGTLPSGSGRPTVDPALLGEFCSNVGIEDGKVQAFAPVKDCHTDHYWQVYFHANKVLKNELAEFPAPMPAQNVNVGPVVG